MRLRLIALCCMLIAGLGFLALPAAPALAENTAITENTGIAGTTGGFAFTGHNPAKVRYTYTPAYAGGASLTPAKASANVIVGKSKPQISVSAPVTDNPYGAKIRITVTLHPVVAGGTIKLYATPFGQARRLVTTGSFDDMGKWYPTYTIIRTTTFTAVFAGDAHYLSNLASRTLYAYARVANRMTGYYRTSKSSSGDTYGIFHGAGTLTLYSTVTPNKDGECLEPETEQYDKGAGWHVDTKYGCDKLDSASHDTAPFSLSSAVGARYRIRGDYFRSSSDTANLNEQAPWLYFIVTK
jgi:hypothetical protein